MDLIALRRMMMQIGGGPVAIGEFTRYERKTLSFPNASNASNWDNGAIIPCSFTPKLIVFYGGANENTHIAYGVFALSPGSTINLGVLHGLTGSGSTLDANYIVNSTASMQRFKIEGNTVYICRAAATVYWQPTDTYTFDIYG